MVRPGMDSSSDVETRETKANIRGRRETKTLPLSSLLYEPCASWEAERAAALELRGSAPVGIPQTQANRAQFVSMCVDEFARNPECASQFTDSHERIDFGVDHILPVSCSSRRATIQSIFENLWFTPRDARNASITLGRLDHRAARGVRSH